MIKENFREAWLLGRISRFEFLSKAVFKEKGSLMPQKTVYITDNYVIKIKDLTSFSSSNGQERVLAAYTK